MINMATFADRLRHAVEVVRENVQVEITGPLPLSEVFNLDAFDQGRSLLSASEVLTYTYRDGRVPRQIVLAVTGIVDGATIIRVAPTGHPWVEDLALSFGYPEEATPFKCVGLM